LWGAFVVTGVMAVNLKVVDSGVMAAALKTVASGSAGNDAGIGWNNHTG
jgi:hypothetical protein